MDLIGIEGWLQKVLHQGTSVETKSSALAIAKGALEDYVDHCLESASHFKTTTTVSRTTADFCFLLSSFVMMTTRASTMTTIA